MPEKDFWKYSRKNCWKFPKISKIREGKHFAKKYESKEFARRMPIQRLLYIITNKNSEKLPKIKLAKKVAKTVLKTFPKGDILQLN